MEEEDKLNQILEEKSKAVIEWVWNTFKTPRIGMDAFAIHANTMAYLYSENIIGPKNASITENPTGLWKFEPEVGNIQEETIFIR